MRMGEVTAARPALRSQPPTRQRVSVYTIRLPLDDLQHSLPTPQCLLAPQQPNSRPCKRVAAPRRSEIIRSNSLPEPRQARRSLLLPNERQHSSDEPSPPNSMPNSGRPRALVGAPRPGPRQVLPTIACGSSVDLSPRDQGGLQGQVVPSSPGPKMCAPSDTIHSWATNATHHHPVMPPVSNLAVKVPHPLARPSANTARIQHGGRTCESSKTCACTGPALLVPWLVQGSQDSRADKRTEIHGHDLRLHLHNDLHQYVGTFQGRQMFNFRGQLCTPRPGPRGPFRTPCITPRTACVPLASLSNFSVADLQRQLFWQRQFALSASASATAPADVRTCILHKQTNICNTSKEPIISNELHPSNTESDWPRNAIDVNDIREWDDSDDEGCQL